MKLKDFHLAFIYHERENQPSFHWHIYLRSQTRFGPMGPLSPPVAPSGYDQDSVRLGPTGFHMAFKTWKSDQQSPRYEPDKFGLLI